VNGSEWKTINILIVRHLLHKFRDVSAVISGIPKDALFLSLSELL